MPNPPPGAIVFDLDGTLVDSAPDLHAALNKVLADEGAPPVTLAQTTAFIGHGIPNLVAKARAALEIDPARETPMTDAMFRHYLAAPANLTRLYPGVVDFLTRLQAMGHPLGLCTNKAIVPTMQILDAFDLRRFFGAIIGGDSLPQKKPDPEPLFRTFAPLGPALAYVGDSEVDEQAAHAAGIPFVLHVQGYRKTDPALMRTCCLVNDYRDTGLAEYLVRMARAANKQT